MLDERNYFRQRICGGNHLDKIEIARGIEKMGAKKMLAERLTAALGNCMNRNPGGVARNDAFGLARRINACHQRAFGFQFFDNHFDDAVGVRDPIEIVLQIADANALGDLGSKERGGRSAGRETAFRPVGLAALTAPPVRTSGSDATFYSRRSLRDAQLLR